MKPGIVVHEDMAREINDNNNAQVVQNSHHKPISTPSKIKMVSGYSLAGFFSPFSIDLISDILHLLNLCFGDTLVQPECFGVRTYI